MYFKKSLGRLYFFFKALKFLYRCEALLVWIIIELILLKKTEKSYVEYLGVPPTVKSAIAMLQKMFPCALNSHTLTQDNRGNNMPIEKGNLQYACLVQAWVR